MSSSENDKRQFRRYKSDSILYLSFKDKIIQAKITDYSAKGIGFITDDSLPLSLVPDIHYKVRNLDLNGEGKIVWIEKAASHVKGGIEKKSVSGFLKHYPLSDILLDLQRSKKNGILDIRRKPIIKRIFINKGDMIFATSNKEDDRFVEVILKAGKITIDQYYQLVDFAKKKGKSPGAALVELGYLKPEDLIWSVRHQVEQIILSLFQWEEGKFMFIEGISLSDKVIRLKLSAANLIYRGVKKISNISYIKNSLPPLDTVLSYSTDPINLFQNLHLEKHDRDILFLIDGKRSIHEILSVSHLDNFQTLKTLYALISTRIIGIGKKEATEDKIYEEVLKEATIEDDHAFIEKVENFYERLASSDYYSILGVEKWATLKKIKKAYYTAAKEFHPDKHLSLPSDTLKDKLNTIFSHLTVAYKTLSDTDMRIQYDKKLSNRPQVTGKSNIDLAKQRFKEGIEVFNTGFYVNAEELFSQAIYLNNSVPEYHFYLGLSLKKLEKFHEAAKSLDRALKLEPMNSRYLAELGHVFLRLGFNRRAKSSFEKAIKNNPANLRAKEGLQKLQNLL